MKRFLLLLLLPFAAGFFQARLRAEEGRLNVVVILVDDLVHEQVLTHASPTARIVHVGKRGGCSSTPRPSSTS